MANEYTVNQPDLLQQFRFAQLPSEQTLQQTQQARQEGLIAQARQKRLQEQQMEAQALKANQGGFGNQDEFAHWGSALAGLGNVAAGHAKGAQNKQARVANEAMLGKSQAAMAQAEEASRMRQEQNQIAAARQSQHNTEAAAAAQAKHQQLQRTQAMLDRQQRAATSRESVDAQLLGKEPIRMVNPETGKETYVGYGRNEKGELGHNYVGADGEEQWSKAFPQLEGFKNAEDIATAKPLSEEGRKSAIFKLDDTLETTREVLPQFDSVLDQLQQYSDQGQTPGELSNTSNLAYVISSDIEMALRSELSAEGEWRKGGTVTDTSTESIAKANGWSRTKHGDFWREHKGDIIVGSDFGPDGVPRRWDRYGGYTEKQDPSKTDSWRKNKIKSVSKRDAKTWQNEFELEGEEGSEVRFRVDPEKYAAAKLSMSKEDQQLAADYAALLGTITRKVTGLEGSAKVLEQIQRSLGVGEFARMDVMAEQTQKLYYQTVEQMNDTISQFDNVGVQGGAQSIGEQYREQEDHWSKRIRTPMTFDQQGSGREPGAVINPNEAQEEAMKHMMPGAIRAAQKNTVAQPVSAVTGLTGNLPSGMVGKFLDPKQRTNKNVLREGDVEPHGPLLPRVKKQLGQHIEDAQASDNPWRKGAADLMEKVASSIPGFSLDTPLSDGKNKQALERGQPGYAALRIRLQQQAGTPRIEDEKKYLAHIVKETGLTYRDARAIREREIKNRKELQKIEDDLAGADYIGDRVSFPKHWKKVGGRPMKPKPFHLFKSTPGAK